MTVPVTTPYNCCEMLLLVSLLENIRTITETTQYWLVRIKQQPQEHYNFRSSIPANQLSLPVLPRESREGVQTTTTRGSELIDVRRARA